MDHKNVYDHLADIYLDQAPGLKPVKEKLEIEQKEELKNNKRKKINIYKILFLISILTLIASFLGFYLKRNHTVTFESALILTPEAAKIDFMFDPAQKSIYTIGLDSINLKNFTSLKFLARADNPKDEISLRVELSNKLKERSEVYISTLPGKWKDYSIDLADFKKITDWTTISTLSFILEEWNTQKSKGTIYFDNVRLTK